MTFRRGQDLDTFDGTDEEIAGTLLALTAWREARGEGFEGMRAAMHVIRNRVLSGEPQFGFPAGPASPARWIGVITMSRQFSAMTHPGDSQLVVWPDSTPEALASYRVAVGHAVRVFYGEDTKDLTHGALFYWNPKTASSERFRRAIAGNPRDWTMTLRLGKHEFFAPSKKKE